MPRRNKTPIHKSLTLTNTETGKRRFATKRQAEDVAEHQMLLKPNLTLTVYKGLDGGWYLTSTKK